jgi:hypothetical protein
VTNSYSINFSASLARTHGVEQAITYSVLKQFQLFRPNNKGWIGITNQEWLEKLPFWSIEQIQSALNQLRVQGLIEIHQAGNTLQSDCHYRLTQRKENAAGVPIVTSIPPSNTNAHTSSDQKFSRSGPIPDRWQPDNHVIQQLTRLGIPEEFILDAIPEFVTYWRESGKSAISWGSKFQERVRKLWMEYETKVAANKLPTQITKDWQPSKDALDILKRDNIDPQFIQDSIAEFLLYWMERGSAEITWNNKFVSHIRRQWQQFCSSIEHSTNPTRIPKNWEPSPECYEIARLAQIDSEFAREQVKPFVLYWSDSNQTSPSWNTKFVQHLKWSWAKRHHLENIGSSAQHEKATGNNPSGNASNKTFIERHQDTSWADDL